MKLLIYADPHLSSYSSIVRSRGEKYSTRLENLLHSLTWAETQAKTYNCDAILCLGDFFDKCDLTSEEITAVQELEWDDTINHIFLVGNHEMGRSNLEFSSSHLFNLCPNSTVIDCPKNFVVQNTEICFLPYVLESNRQKLNDYFKFWLPPKNRIIFSHNDIKDIQMGSFLSTEGFELDDIEENCALFINGHLHNMSCYGKKVINVGNLTGQNFSEDALVYKHCIMVLNTETMENVFIENPYALNFYKLDFTADCNPSDYTNIDRALAKITKKAVVTIKVLPEYYDYTKSIVNNMSNIVESRIIADSSTLSTKVEGASVIKTNVDHLTQFVQYIKSELGVAPEIIEELNKVVE